MPSCQLWLKFNRQMEPDDTSSWSSALCRSPLASRCLQSQSIGAPGGVLELAWKLGI